MVFFRRFRRVRKRAPSLDRRPYGWPAERGPAHGTEIQPSRQRSRRPQGRAAFHSLFDQRARVWQRCGRRDAERARHSLYLAQSGCELSRPARQHRQLPRQRAAADAVVPARGGGGRDCARLCQGHRQGDGGCGSFQRRPVPRHNGDLQRLVRPHADPDPRRHRPGRCDEAAALDRLDSHRGRPGRDYPQFQQVGRPAGLGRCRPRGGAARLLARQHHAVRSDLHQPRR